MSWIYDHIILAVGLIFGVIFIAYLSTQKRSTSNAFAWLLLIVFIPYIGVPLYFIFGGSKINEVISRKRKIYEKCKLEMRDGATEAEKILANSYVPPISHCNKMKVLGSGEQAYQCIMNLIAEAKESIEVETFILGKGHVGHKILGALTEKAKQGVKVRFLLDGLIAFTYPKKHLKEFQKAGGELLYFLPLRFRIFRSHINLRNHRKVLIVDGRIGIMGGMNLAGEYMGPVPSKTRWCDIAIKIEGDIVNRARHLFYYDWNFALTKGQERVEIEDMPLDPCIHPVPAQIVASGPDVVGEPFYNALITKIFEAKERVIVVTPYYIPDLGLVKALGLACLRGVEVTLIVPRKSNHAMADFARSTHIRSLINAGGNVLFFEPTMMHAKVILIDDDFAVVGSANLDMRSLFLNFEACLFFYGEEQVADVLKWIRHITVYCSERRIYANPTRMRLVLENIALLMAPLL